MKISFDHSYDYDYLLLLIYALSLLLHYIDGMTGRSGLGV